MLVIDTSYADDKFKCQRDIEETREFINRTVNNAWYAKVLNGIPLTGPVSVDSFNNFHDCMNHKCNSEIEAKVSNAPLTIWYIGGNQKGGQGLQKFKQLKAYRMFVFEAAKANIETLRTSLQGINGVRVLDYGIGKENKTFSAPYWDLGTTVYSEPCEGPDAFGCTEMKIRNFFVALTELGFNKSENNYLYTNCEGCEYEIAEMLIAEKEIVKYFQVLEIGTHFIPDPNMNKRFCSIRRKLAKTHRLVCSLLFGMDVWVL